MNSRSLYRADVINRVEDLTNYPRFMVAISFSHEIDTIEGFKQIPYKGKKALFVRQYKTLPAAIKAVKELAIGYDEMTDIDKTVSVNFSIIDLISQTIMIPNCNDVALYQTGAENTKGYRIGKSQLDRMTTGTSRIRSVVSDGTHIEKIMKGNWPTLPYVGDVSFTDVTNPAAESTPTRLLVANQIATDRIPESGAYRDPDLASNVSSGSFTSAYSIGLSIINRLEAAIVQNKDIQKVPGGIDSVTLMLSQLNNSLFDIVQSARQSVLLDIESNQYETYPNKYAAEFLIANKLSDRIYAIAQRVVEPLIARSAVYNIFKR